MRLGLLTLLAALSISGVTAYYSIVGLTAIFAGAFWPIVVMGSVIESGKIVSTIWLHYNWPRTKWQIKSLLLVFFVGVVMLVTSMGVFGFLSKAHLDQAVPSGDIQQQVNLFDEKIKTQQDNIAISRKAVQQLDAVVDQTMSRSTNEKGALNSSYLRRSQKKERAELQKEIDSAQKEITSLQEQRAPVASKMRKADADVGPIKYIAALIYGDKVDQSLLDSAVRIVIIMIVCALDPFAIVLLLASTVSIDWEKEKKEKKEANPIGMDMQLDEIKKMLSIRETEVRDEYASLLEQLQTANSSVNEKLLDSEKIRSKMQEQVDILVNEIQLLGDDLQGKEDELKLLTGENDITTTELEDLRVQYRELQDRKKVLEDELEQAKKNLEHAVQIIADLEGLKAQVISNDRENTLVTEPTPVPIIETKQPLASPTNVSFGTEFPPENPTSESLFLRTDFKPSKLFKWDQSRWVEVDKSVTNVYEFDDNYLATLVEKLNTGEYSGIELSPVEIAQVEDYILRQKNK